MAGHLSPGQHVYGTEFNGRITPMLTVPQRQRRFFADMERNHQNQILDLGNYHTVKKTKYPGDISCSKAQDSPVKQRRAALLRCEELERAENAQETAQPILILKTAPYDFFGYYTPGYEIPSAGISNLWQFLPISKTWREDRWKFVRTIIEKYRAQQEILDEFAAKGVFKKEDIWPPIFRVCPTTGRFYPTKDYEISRDPFQHIIPKHYHHMFYNKVFSFPRETGEEEDTEENQMRAAQSNSIFSGYNKPYLPRCQVDEDGVIPLLIPGGDIAAGVRGPWQMVPTHINKTAARSFNEHDMKLYDQVRMKAETDWGKYGHPDFYHAHPELFQPGQASEPTNNGAKNSAAGPHAPKAASSPIASPNDSLDTMREEAIKSMNRNNAPASQIQGIQANDANISIEVVADMTPGPDVEEIPKDVGQLSPRDANNKNSAKWLRMAQQEASKKKSQKPVKKAQEGNIVSDSVSARQPGCVDLVNIPYRRDKASRGSRGSIDARWREPPAQVTYTLSDINKSFNSKAHRLYPEATQDFKKKFPSVAAAWGLNDTPDRRDEIPRTGSPSGPSQGYQLRRERSQQHGRDQLMLQYQHSRDDEDPPRTRARSTQSPASSAHSETNSERDEASPRSTTRGKLTSARKRKLPR